MTEEEIKALVEAKEAADKRAADAEALALAAKQEADKAKQDVSKIVDELTEERRKKNEALQKANTINPGEPDVNSIVEQALQKKEDERRKAELEAAIAEFKSSKPEFQADTAGLVFGKFTEQLSKFNLNDVQTKDQAKSRLEEIYRFVNFKGADGSGSEYEGTNQGVHTVPGDKADQLKVDVEAAVKSAGVTTERFTELKKKYPDALTGLGIE